LTVAAALAQVGEFSFILSQQAMNLNILPEEGFDLLVAASLISIALNPLLFKCSAITLKSVTKRVGLMSPKIFETSFPKQKKAIIVGFGPIGHGVCETLEKMGYSALIIDTNLEIIEKLIYSHKKALYGDASHRQILEAARIEEAELLVITSAESDTALNIVKTAIQLKPDIKIIVRANYLSDQKRFKIPGIQVICNEEEAKTAFIKALEGH